MHTKHKLAVTALVERSLRETFDRGIVNASARQRYSVRAFACVSECKTASRCSVRVRRTRTGRRRSYSSGQRTFVERGGEEATSSLSEREVAARRRNESPVHVVVYSRVLYTGERALCARRFQH